MEGRPAAQAGWRPEAAAAPALPGGATPPPPCGSNVLPAAATAAAAADAAADFDGGASGRWVEPAGWREGEVHRQIVGVANEVATPWILGFQLFYMLSFYLQSVPPYPPFSVKDGLGYANCTCLKLAGACSTPMLRLLQERPAIIATDTA